MRFHLGLVPRPDPIGPVLIASDGSRIVALDFGLPGGRLTTQLARRFGPDLGFDETEDPQGFGSAVAAYFGGDMAALDALPVEGGGTAFERAVWAMLRTIPPGQTRSYGEIARAFGRPGASRAVGLANGRNPVNLVVPCHRVIGSGGALTGYGGGLARKQWLLAHEGACNPAAQPSLPGL